MKNLKIDHWSKYIVVCFVAIGTASVATTSLNVFLVSIGGFLFGIGELANHTKETKIYLHETLNRENIITANSYTRTPKVVGIILGAIGALIFIIGITKIVIYSS